METALSMCICLEGEKHFHPLRTPGGIDGIIAIHKGKDTPVRNCKYENRRPSLSFTVKNLLKIKMVTLLLRHPVFTI